MQTTARVAEEVLYTLDKLEAEEATAAARDQFNAGRRQRRIVDAFLNVGEDAIRTTAKADADCSSATDARRKRRAHVFALWCLDPVVTAGRVARGTRSSPSRLLRLKR